MSKKQSVDIVSKLPLIKPERRQFLKYAALGGAALALNVFVSKMGGVSSILSGPQDTSLGGKEKKIHSGKDFTLVEKKGELLVYNTKGENLLIIEKD